MSELELLQNNIRKLPKEIIYKILFYTYDIQPKFLLSDIRNLQCTKSLLYTIYRSYWEDEYNDWLINDITAFANNYNATMYGYVPHFFSIFLRNKLLNTDEDVDKYISILGTRSVKSQINIFLGLFTIEDRVKFTWRALLDYNLKDV